MKTWLVVVAFVVVVAGCSTAAGGASTGAGGSGAGGGTAAPAGPVSTGCATTMRPFLDLEHDIDSRLDVGLSFAEYGNKVGDAKVAYDKVVAHMSGLDQDCLGRVGKPTEDALNKYVAAYNQWNDCIKKTGCTLDSIQPALQIQWAGAKDSIKSAEGAMPAGS